MDPAHDLLAAIQARDAAKALTLIGGDARLADARTPEGMPALQLAIYMRLPRVVDALLAAGAPVSIHEAAMLGDAARVRALAAKDAALVRAKAVDGGTPLHYAAHFGQKETAVALLDLGADPDAMAGAPFLNAPLHAACAGGRGDLVATLLAAGAKPDARDANGYTPLHVAAASGSAESVRHLLARGATRDAPGPGGKTPLDVAREREQDEAAALLG